MKSVKDGAPAGWCNNSGTTGPSCWTLRVSARYIWWRIQGSDRHRRGSPLGRKAVPLTVRPIGEPYGIFMLKVLLLFQGLLGTLLTLLSLDPRIHSVHSAYFSYPLPHDRTTQLGSAIASFFCLAWSYALHQRLTIAWAVGWVVLSGAFLVVGVSSARALLSQVPGLSGWVASCIVGVGFLVGGVHLGRLWKDQKDFFRGKDS